MTFGEEAMFYKNENHLSKINFSNELTFFKFFENFSAFFFGYPFMAFRSIWIWFSFLFLFLLFSPLFSSFYQTTIIDSNWKQKIIHPDIMYNLFYTTNNGFCAIFKKILYRVVAFTAQQNNRYLLVRNGSTNFKIIHCLLFIFCGNSFS